MIGAGLLARNAVERGLTVQAVGQDLAGPGLQGRHGVLRAGGPDRSRWRRSASTSSATAARRASATPGRCPRRSPNVVNAEDLAVVSVLSGNRNFEGRINPDVKMNYLASPPLVVAYALAGTMDIDLLDEPLGQDADGDDVFLHDIWPSVGGGRPGRRGRRALGDVPEVLRRGVRGRREWNAPGGARGRPLRLGRGLDLRPPPLVPRGRAARARAAGRRRGRAGARAARRLGDHRPHLARPARSRRARPPRSTSTSTASSSATSTPTAPAAATTR